MSATWIDGATGLRVTISLGPGPYTEDLLSQLVRHGCLVRAIRSWPEFLVEQWNSATKTWDQVHTLRLYYHVVRAVWATWRRIPWLGRHRTPQTLLFDGFDRLAARQLGDPDLFLGWSQVALRSMGVAKVRGIPAALEHPMLHVELWQETMLEEYGRHAPDTSEYYSLFPRALVRRMLAEYERADYVIVPSTAARDSFLRRGVGRRRLVEVPFGVDTEVFAVGPSASSPTFRVLFVGRLELLKGTHYLLEAWSSLGLKDARLRLAGPVLPEIRQPLAAAMCHDNIEVLGQVPRDRVKRLLQESDVVVFPSICDAFGLVILEAMACGRPVIATTRSGGPDVITDGVDGFVVPPRDPKAIAERLEWLYLHRDECREMGRRARLQVEGRYDLASYGDRLVRAYTQMVASRRSPTATPPPAVEDA